MGFATAATTSLTMTGERFAIIEFLQSGPNGTIRQARGQGDGGDAAMPKRTSFNCGPTSSSTLIQVVE